jgi:hypothetical protein
MLIRRISAAAATLSLLGVAASGGVASAATTPALPSAPPLPLLTFVPPKVGPLGVAIGATIIGGKTISPGVNVFLPGVSLPPLNWTPSMNGAPAN